jgi:hypothetical protein
VTVNMKEYPESDIISPAMNRDLMRINLLLLELDESQPSSVDSTLVAYDCSKSLTVTKPACASW